ncbi:MAG TPA: VWA domain-containing protein, partial [Gemmataceae bacterium]|nr:VWA domain-containing protein [Gemmataceae bacterium]
VGYLIAAALAFGGGGYLAAVLGAGLAVAGKRLANVQFLYPAWLLLLLVIPLLVLVSYRSLAGLGPVRRWVALGLRCALVALLVLALAEPRLRHESESQTVIFVIDRSLSIPEEPATDASGQTVDARWERIKKFVNDAVAERGPGHKDDRAGLIVFGRRPRLELPPSDSPRFNFQEVFGTIDGNYTDIAAALKLALASFPEQTGKRIVLLSDGNENLGSAEDQARFARENGVQIDVVPLASGHRTENEILVQSIEAPAQVEQGAQLPIRVLIRSFNPHLVVGTLTVKQISEGQAIDVPGSPRQNVALQQGLNSFTFKQPLTAEKRSYTYEAEFLPEFVADEKGNVLAKGLPGDRPQNNRATTHVVARGQRRILLVEPHAGDHQYLVDRLTQSRAKFQVDTIEVEKLPPDKDKLAVLFSNYDCIVLANVAASDVSEGAIGDNPGASLTEAQQEMIRSNTHDQGCGLVMIGGPNGYGAGGWRGTPVEKALPVDCDIKSVEVGGRGGLVLIMHASEIAEGNRWQKIIAKLAINKLSSDDMVGVLHYAWAGQGGSGHQWHIPFQVVGENRGRLLALVESLNPGDMPDVDPAFTKAYNELTKQEYGLTTRHVIFISDGDHWNASQALLARMRAAKITISTVCITSHGQLEEQKMAAVARATNGRFYSVKNPSALPAIYTRETRVVSQSLLYERRLQPREVFRAGPTEGLPDVLPPLYGFVRTTAKSSPLVEVPIVTPPITGQQFPVLAYWHYGLGKAAAFTSDARTNPGRKAWDRDWAQSSIYSKFWEQVIEWALRPVESKHLVMLPPEYKDGTVKVTIEAHDDRNKPILDLSLRGGVTTPGTKPDAKQQQELKFEETAPGQYVSEFKADEAGSYFVSAQAVRRVPIKDKNGKVHEAEEGFDSVRSGVTIPYSPEFSDLETNTGLLERLRTMTDGKAYQDDGAALAEVARTADVYRPGLPRF